MTKEISKYGEQLKNIYEAEFQKHGASLKSLFTPKGRQFYRYDAIARIGIKPKDSVLDVGCGFGLFYEYANKKKLKLHYTGYDVAEPMIAVSKNKYPECTFKVVDILESTSKRKWDWVILSGVFNLSVSKTKKGHWEWVKKMIDKMFELSKKGVAFDFMTDYVDYEQKNAFHMNPGEIYDYCRKNVTPRINIISDYMSYEFMVHIYKNVKHINQVYKEKINK